MLAVPGASAALAALVVSGLAGRFCFEGFLPRKGPERRSRLAALAASEAVSVLYEAPGRVAATLAELSACCGPERRVAVCRELTKLHEEVFRGSLAEACGARLVTEPRGEYVLVLDKAEAVAVDPEERFEALGLLLGAGFSARDAVRAVEALYGGAHRELYERAIALGAAPRTGGGAG